MTLQFHPAAIDESVEAASYYDHQQLGFGTKFEEALQAGLDAIMEAPSRWPIQTSKTRRYLLKRFPYAIVYLLHEDVVKIIAVMHLRRRPGYWADRL